MKIFCIAVTAIFLTLSSYSQTQKQADLVKSFFSGDGKYVLQDAAHPLSTCISTKVSEWPEHKYFITLNYRYNSKDFSCEYFLLLDNSGRFLSLRMQSCGDKDSKCFFACRFVNFDDITTSKDRERYEKYLGKSLESMSCEQYALVKMYFLWVDQNYYDKY